MRQNKRNIIASSALFDAEWYAKTYEVPGNPAKHYLTKGWKLGFNPSRTFSTYKYLELNPDVAVVRMNPLLHYELHGKGEGRKYSINQNTTEQNIIASSALFDAEWYAKTYEVSGDPAEHYLTKGWKLKFDPSRAFSTHEYLELYPDIAAVGMNPLLHYELYGKSEGRQCSIDDDMFLDPLVPMSVQIAHGVWPQRLKELCDREGAEVLEVGSRVVTGANFRSMFEKANYTGFDLYEGENVDVSGDAHKLSSYFQDRKFDLIFSSAVFEHLAMPWIVANEMIKLLKPGGYIFVETHYSYSSHERPWHFFQFSEQALKVLFSEEHGIECIEAGVSNPLVARFSRSSACAEYLRGRYVPGMYCHSEFLGKKIREVDDFSFDTIDLNKLVNGTSYPRKASE